MASQTNGIARAVAENPARRPGKFEKPELEVTRLANSDEMQTADLYTPYFRITQIAKRYNTTRQTVYNWLESGRLRPPRLHPVDGASYWLERDLPPLSK